jgi:hypothetical protein
VRNVVMPCLAASSASTASKANNRKLIWHVF